MLRKSFRPAVVALALLSFCAVAQAAEKRCGWIANPTPGNWQLNDPKGEWELAAQGGYQAPGMDKIPDLTTKQWIKTNGDYGYGCACITAITDAKEKRVTKLLRFQQRPLKACEKDRRLKTPGN